MLIQGWCSVMLCEFSAALAFHAFRSMKSVRIILQIHARCRSYPPYFPIHSSFHRHWQVKSAWSKLNVCILLLPCWCVKGHCVYVCLEYALTTYYPFFCNDLVGSCSFGLILCLFRSQLFHFSLLVFDSHSVNQHAHPRRYIVLH